MPEFILSDKADHCPYCGKVLYLPPRCCEPMQDEYYKEIKEEYERAYSENNKRYYKRMV
jgi:hypothetical protein